MRLMLYNAFVFTKASHKDSKVVVQLTANPTSLVQKPTTHEEEKAALILFLTGPLQYGICFIRHFIMILSTAIPIVA